MKIHFFERNPADGQVSIEKLFSVIKKELSRKGVAYSVFVNPFKLSEMLKTLMYFKKNQGEINHITGDIHWSSLVLDSRKTLLTVHDLSGYYQHTGLKKKLYYLLWIYLPLKKLRYITVISEKTKKEISWLLPSVASKIKVIPNCITVDILPIKFKDFSKMKLLIVGTRENKNIEKVLEACKDLNIALSIVGRLNERQSRLLEDYQYDFSNYINISDEKLRELYDESNVLCFPSTYEGFGLPILEAQARNCMVITSDLSPMKDVAGKGALLVNPHHAEEIRNAVLRIANEEDLRRELVIRGQENVKNYTPDWVVEQYTELYKKILANK